jgi:hypothetical protein
MGTERKLAVGRSAIESGGFLADLSVEPPCQLAADYYCATHALRLATDLAKSAHLADLGEHAVVRMCDIHGPEALT